MKTPISRLVVALALVLAISLFIANVSADVTPSYPPVPLGDIEIAYDDGTFLNHGRSVDDAYSLRVLFTPTADGLLHQVRIAWWDDGHGRSGNFHLVVEDVSSGATVTSPEMSNTPGEWQIVDVSSLGFLTSGDFYVYIYASSGSWIVVYLDESPTIEHPGRFQQKESAGAWYDVEDLGVRVTITPSPGQVIPEVPFGTAITFLSMVMALVGFAGFKRFRPKLRLQ